MFITVFAWRLMQILTNFAIKAQMNSNIKLIHSNKSDDKVLLISNNYNSNIFTISAQLFHYKWRQWWSWGAVRCDEIRNVMSRMRCVDVYSIVWNKQNNNTNIIIILIYLSFSHTSHSIMSSKLISQLLININEIVC